MDFAVVASAGAGAAGARFAAVERETLTAGALRAGGAAGVVAMTWISGSFVVLERPLELLKAASCAATVPNGLASTAASVQSDPRKSAPRCR